MIALKIVGAADGSPCPQAGHYVRFCDFDADDGRGKLVTTRKIERAMMFGTFKLAYDYWHMASKVAPLRDDGRPNRPLTAWNLEIVRVNLSKDGGRDA